MAHFLQPNSLQTSQGPHLHEPQSSTATSVWGKQQGAGSGSCRSGPCGKRAGAALSQPSWLQQTQQNPAERLSKADSTSGKACLRAGRKCHREEEGTKQKEWETAEGTPRSEKEVEEEQISTTATVDDPSWCRWICSEGTMAHGQPVLEQIFNLKNCSQWGAHARAEGRCEKAGAAERNHLTLTVTPLPPTPCREGYRSLEH